MTSFADTRRRTLLICRGANALTVLAFLVFFAFVTVSNDFDWDHFLSAAEVDLRSWLLDGAPPLWSYQLCGGVTRAGDPQAFGLSPLFTVVLLLGSFWGLKLGIVLLALLGFWGMNGLLRIFFTGGRPERRLGASSRAMLRAVSLAFVLGNYFAWHFHEGHVTFALDYVALALVRCLLEGWFHPVPRRYGVYVAALGWAYFSGGVYHSLIFFFLPLTLALVLPLLAVSLLPSLRSRIPEGAALRLGKLVGFAALGTLLGAYKVYLVAAFQLAHPRTVEPSTHVEGATLMQSLIYQFAPTLDGAFFGAIRQGGQWGIWETSAFTLNAWWCLIAATLLAVMRLHRSSREVARNPSSWILWALIASVALTGWAFAVGDTTSLSAHRLLNHFLSNSVRVAGRYQVLFTVAWAWVAALLLGRHRVLRRVFFAAGVVLVPLLVAANFATFRSTLRPDSVSEILSLEVAPTREMQWVTLVPERSATNSSMYGAILAGHAVLNCYDPIWRVSAMNREFKVIHPDLGAPGSRPRPGTLPLIDLRRGAPPESCVLESHFTQSEVQLAPSCPPGTCVNLNALQDDTAPVRYSQRAGKFCRPSP